MTFGFLLLLNPQKYKKIGKNKDILVPVLSSAYKVLKKVGHRIMLTNSELKYIIKRIKSLEIRDIFLKGTTKKVINKKGGFFGYVICSLKKRYLNH